MNSSELTKRCFMCKCEKPLEAFSFTSLRKCGRDYRCKECDRARRKKYRSKDRGQIAVSQESNLFEANEQLDSKRLHEILHYNPESGLFTWIEPPRFSRKQAGDPAGSPSGNGYIRIMIGRRAYRAHQLAWLYMYGDWPKLQIDHINGVRDDNRIVNLRDVDASANMHNTKLDHFKNSSGFVGVRWDSKTKAWLAKITVKHRVIELGRASTPEAAHRLYVEAKRQLQPGALKGLTPAGGDRG